VPTPSLVESNVLLSFRAASASVATTSSLPILGTASFNFASPVSADELWVCTFLAIFPAFCFVHFFSGYISQVYGTRGAIRCSLFDDQEAAVFASQSPGSTPVQYALPTNQPENSFFWMMVAASTVLHHQHDSTSVDIDSLRRVLDRSADLPGAVSVSQLIDAALRRYYRDRLDAFWHRADKWDHGRL
jgi:hypothetical protein